MPCAIFGTHTRSSTPHKSENIRAWEQMRDRKLLTRMYCSTRVGKALSIDRKIEIVLDTRAHSYVSVVVGKYLQHKPEMYAVRTQSANGAFPFLIKPIYFSLDWYNDDFNGSRARSNVRDHLICFFCVGGEHSLLCTPQTERESWRNCWKFTSYRRRKFDVGHPSVCGTDENKTRKRNNSMIRIVLLIFVEILFALVCSLFVRQKICAVSDSFKTFRWRTNRIIIFIIPFSIPTYSVMAFCAAHAQYVCAENMGTSDDRVWDQTTIKTNVHERESKTYFCFVLWKVRTLKEKRPKTNKRTNEWHREMKERQSFCSNCVANVEIILFSMSLGLFACENKVWCLDMQVKLNSSLVIIIMKWL